MREDSRLMISGMSSSDTEPSLKLSLTAASRSEGTLTLDRISCRTMPLSRPELPGTSSPVKKSPASLLNSSLPSRGQEG